MSNLLVGPGGVPWTPESVNAGLGPDGALPESTLALLSLSAVDGSIIGYTETHSLQALVELIYIKQGNDVLAKALDELNTSLSIAENASTTLANIQNLHNQVTVQGADAFPLPPLAEGNKGYGSDDDPMTIATTAYIYEDLTDNTVKTTYAAPPFGNINLLGTFNKTFVIRNRGDYQSVYNTLGSGYFKNIPPTFQVTIPPTATTPAQTAIITSSTQPEYQWFVGQLNSARNSLLSQIESLEGIPYTSPTNPNQNAIDVLRNVYNQMPDLTAPFSTVKAWVMDGNDLTVGAVASKAGAIQNNLNIAITSMQSLNGQQNQAVRRYMFIFQQYQQSAAAILSALQQLFHTLSSNINRT